jgi:hypothetical protein
MGNSHPRTHTKAQEDTHHCGQVGHWNSHCIVPHTCCHLTKRCVVPLKHLYFIQGCFYGGQMKHNHPYRPSHSKHKRETDQQMLLAHETVDRDTPSPDGPDSEVEATEEDALALSFPPPANSSLFSTASTPTQYDTSFWDDSPLEVVSFTSEPAPSSTTGFDGWGTGTWGDPWYTSPCAKCHAQK